MIRTPIVVVVGVLVAGLATAEATPSPPAVHSKVPGVLPTEIDHNMIMWAVAKVTTKIHGCTTGLSFTGRVDLEVTVSPTGGVTKVIVKQTPHEYLGTCMSEAIRKARFPKTAKGGTFLRSIYVTPKRV